jgi:hypothetical protein
LKIIFQLSGNTGFIVSLPKTETYTASDEDEELCFHDQSAVVLLDWMSEKLFWWQ